ncbi:MAG: substrate-binding domain-containing protein [Deltaproteobacteria bacterium]|nr:substrate-binding domain-containing protein [Deltaproteobacteria bacterium]
MKIRSLAAVVGIGLIILFAHGLGAEAAEVKVIGANPVKAVVQELGAQFERESGHKVVTKFLTGVKGEIDAGEPFDVAISTTSGIDGLIKEGKIIAATRADVAYAGIGVGVRAGAPKPDLSSVEVFKRALLNAKSVAHSRAGTSGVHFKGLLERFGIAEEMKPKLKPLSGDALVQAVPSGEAEMIVGTMSDIVAGGTVLVGPLPPELQLYIRSAAGVVTTAKEPEAAKALIKFLTAPAAIPVIKVNGMEPGSP